jgi:hypothetical protein
MGEFCDGEVTPAETSENERDIEYNAEILVGGTSSECVRNALFPGRQLVMFRNGKRVYGLLICGPLSGSPVVCCQNTALCHIRVRYCTEKMEDCVRLGIDGGGLCNNHSGMAKCRYAN